MKFRKDINGLRAFAVIAVVLFHFNSVWMPGGFAGVDVFFVISGFLMTGIIFRGLENNNFSILDFYVARANRIIPALSALCITLLVFGWFYLTPLEYKALGKHIASSIGFLSNIIYFTEAGYFDSASHEKWLLHTWSLSVEWQFYIIYPLVLVVLGKVLTLRVLKLLIAISTVFGFAFSIYATYHWPNASYYLFPMRAWEMMIGGVAFLYPLKIGERNSKLTELLGLILIIGSYFLISSNDPWPGYLAFFPVLGSFLVIQAQRNESFLTGNIIFQKIGSWSYSIYLWHWPFVVAIYTFSLSDEFIYLGIASSILLGFLSYKYIEKIEFPRSFPRFRDYLKCKPVYIAGIVGVLGSLLFIKYDALTNLRLSEEQILIVDQQKRNSREAICGSVINGKSPECKYGQGPVKAIVIGDSHAQAQVATIGQLTSKYGGSVLDLGLSGCSTIKDMYTLSGSGSNPDYNCGKLVNNAINIAAEQYPGIPVIIINRNSQYLYGKNEDGEIIHPPKQFVDQVFSKRNDEYRANLVNHMVDTICEFSQSNPVYLVRPIPELVNNVPLTMFRNLTVTGNSGTIELPVTSYYQRQKTAFTMQDQAAKKCNVEILDPIPYLCDNEYCYGSKNGIPLYFDDDHLSKYGSELISPIYEQVFE